VQVVAIDGDTTAYSTLTLPEKALVPVDRRLLRPLDPAQHFAEQEQIVRVEAGASSTIEDVGSSKAESYDSLTSVFRLFRTLSGMEELDRFEFLTRWPGLAREAKLELYSKHACHELHFFLWNKDPQFFAEIVRPYPRAEGAQDLPRPLAARGRPRALSRAGRVRPAQHGRAHPADGACSESPRGWRAPSARSG
jgi:hypothetical protein